MLSGESAARQSAIDERLVEALARLAEGEEHHTQALRRLEEALAQLQAGAASALLLSDALAALRRLQR